MSARPIEVVERALALYREGDFDALLELVHSDVVLDATRRRVNPAVYEGRAGFRRLIAEMGEVWRDARFEVDDLEELGDRVIGGGTWRAVGRESGIAVADTFADAWTVRDGLIVRWEIGYATADDARRAVPA